MKQIFQLKYIVVLSFIFQSFSVFSQSVMETLGYDGPPIVITFEATSNTACDVSLANGTLTATAKSDGNPVPVGTVFEWFVGDNTAVPFNEGVDGSIVAVNDYTSKIENVKAGQFTVKVTDNSSGATSTESYIIGEATTNPSVTIVEDARQTSCDSANPNGRLLASVGGSVNDYTFEWFEGNNTSTPLGTTVGTTSGINGEVAEGLNTGSYTVRVTQNSTGCNNIQSLYLQENILLPEILGLTSTDQNSCDPSGSVTINDADVSSGNTADYTFTWYSGNLDTVIPGVVGPVLNVSNYANIGAGTYYVTATNDAGCTSEAITATIQDISINPVIAFVQTANTACDMDNNADGALEATVTTDGTALPAGSVFEWFVGAGAATAFVDGTDGTIVEIADHISKIQNVKPGNYTLKVTDGATGCSVTNAFTVGNAPANLAINDATITDQNRCDPSGSIAINDADVTSGNTADYIFTWYRDNMDNDIPGVDGPVLNVSNYGTIGAGTYYVTATNDTGCTSATLTAVIEDVSENPAIDFTATQNPADEPDASKGSISAVATTKGSPVGNGSTFEWFIGNDTTTPFTEGTDGNTSIDGNTSSIINIKSGQYTLKVTDAASGCSFTRSYTLLPASTNPQVVSIYTEADDPTNQSPIALFVEFSRPIQDFDLSKVIIDNGTANELNQINETTFNFNITPDADGLITVNIPAAVAVDMDDNPNDEAEPFTIAYDGTSPTVVLSADISEVTDISPVPVTITFNENVEGFETSDLEITNANATEFEQLNASEYTVLIAPVEAGKVVITVAAGAAFDAAGNPNTEGNFLFTFEIPDPTVVAFSSPTSETIVKSIGGVINLTISLTNPHPLKTTRVDVALTQGKVAAIEKNYSTQTVTFPAGSNEEQSVIITIADDYEIEGDELLIFTLQNVSGGYEAIIGEANTFELTIKDDGITGLEPEVISGVDIFPNPVANYLQVNLDRARFTKAAKVILYDMYGRQVRMQQLTLEFNHINVSDLKNGIYMLHFFNQNNVMVQKIQVSK